LPAYDPAEAARTDTHVRDLLRHAQQLGYPDPDRGNALPDWVWFDQKNEVFSLRMRDFGCHPGQPVPPAPDYCRNLSDPSQELACRDDRCVPVDLYYDGGAAVHPDLNTEERPFSFTNRWASFAFTKPDGSAGYSGAWTALLAGVVSLDAQAKSISVFNTYNPTDHVLRIDRPFNEGLLSLGSNPWTLLRSDYYHAWETAQLLAKPWGRLTDAASNRLDALIHDGGGARDPIDAQKWWTLALPDSVHRASAWASTAEAGAYQTNVGSTPVEARRWAELATWYPALAAPAGATPLDPLRGLLMVGVSLEGLPGQGRNVSFQELGGSDGPGTNGTPSHSYLWMSKYHEVWRGFRVIRGMFKQ
jgi:hypothetical protein